MGNASILPQLSFMNVFGILLVPAFALLAPGPAWYWMGLFLVATGILGGRSLRLEQRARQLAKHPPENDDATQKTVLRLKMDALLYSLLQGLVDLAAAIVWLKILSWVVLVVLGISSLLFLWMIRRQLT